MGGKMTRTRQKARKQAKARPAKVYGSIDPIADDKAFASELWSEEEKQDAMGGWILALFAAALLVAAVLIFIPQ